MKLGVLLSTFALVWCIAVVLKVAGVRSRREPYRFRQWDGGLMLRGTELGPAGTLRFLGLAIVLGVIAAYQLVRWSQL
jgi:hypothetical protein